MRWIWLAVVLLPIALAIPVPSGANLVTIECNGLKEVYYTASNGSITFFYTENPTPDLVKTFYVYFKLLNTVDDLSFISDSTITSLRSLSDALSEYRLRLVQAKSLANRYDVNLDVSELNQEAGLLSRSLELIAKKTENLKEKLHSFLKQPRCGFNPDLSVLDDFSNVYAVANNMLTLSQRIKTGLSTEKNIDLSLVNALSELITPPFNRSDLDELLSRSKSDKQLLSLILNPDPKDLANLVQLSKSYEAYTEAKDLLSQQITTPLGIFDSVDAAISFIQLNKDRLARGEDVDKAVKLYAEVKKALQEKKYVEAKFLAERLRSLVFDILKAGWKEKKREEGPSWGIVVGLLLVVGLIFILLRRRKGDEEADVEDADAALLVDLDE